MADIKTKYTGVYYRDLQNKDRTFFITYKVNGKLKREKVGTRNEGVTAVYASKIRAKKISTYRLGVDAPFNQNIHKPTFDKCFELYKKSIEGKSDTPNTISRYELHVKDTFGDLKLDEISTELLENFRNKSRKKISFKTKREYSPKTINDWLNIISTVFNYMIKKHDLNIKNPATAIKLEREKVDNDRERYLELDEIKKLWDILNNRVGKKYKEIVTENMKIFLALSLSTGARLTSVLTISKADINLEQNTILIKNHKTNKTYLGFIHPSYKELIKSRIEKIKPVDYLVNSSPKVMSRTSIEKVFKPIFDKNFNEGLDIDDRKRRVVIHTLRHTFASQLAIQGTPIYTIMKLMNHADIKQTIRYAKLNKNNGLDAVIELKI